MIELPSEVYEPISSLSDIEPPMNRRMGQMRQC